MEKIIIKRTAIVAAVLIISISAAYYVLAWTTEMMVLEEAGISNKNYPQIMKNRKTNPAKMSWNKIATARLEGFDSKPGVVEMINEDCGGEEHYLRTEGGMLRTGYCLGFNDGAATTTVDSVAKLKEIFAPVDSGKKAISFVAVTASDYKVGENDIIDGELALIEGGYLVKIIHNNTFGCGSHEPAEAVYKVTAAGDVTLESRGEPAIDPTQPEICVD